MAFRNVDTRVSFPSLEQEIGQWWKDNGILMKALKGGDSARPFVFFEGPPTANGRPGVHHVEARASKDIILRYHRMLGEKILGDRGGWDTHGLPVEIEVEKELGFSGKPDIEKYGIARFNQACKESAFRYIQEWERLTERMAYWIDLDDAYVTYHNEYIESLWWIMKTLWDRELLFRDYKVTMHCPRCGTSLSDHEVSLGFQDDVDDPSVWVRFRVKPSGHLMDDQLAGAAFLAWTTTPWTLPANVALAVNPFATYVLAEYTGGDTAERLVVAEDLAGAVLGEGNFRVLGTFEGQAFWGVRYENLFEGVAGRGTSPEVLARAYQVVADDFVSLDEGTGIVHIAPAYGDLETGRKYNLPTLFSVDLAGQTYGEFDRLGFGGKFFKEADPLITRNLRDRGLLFKSGRVKHSYPFCWRCDTPLLYYAKPSWYIKTTARKDRLIANNQRIHWVPDHIKDGRFGNWLENNVDWALSRERYWGTPLPLWVCDFCGHTEAVGSVKELSEKAGRDLTGLDLHRPYVDEVTWRCPECGDGTSRRILDVADCWFDSGSMQVAQWHYPFENRELFEVAGKADFISEAIDQTRGWFYTLHAVGTLLFDRQAFDNVICLGHILDINGVKMSKSRGNVVDPWRLLDGYGADATRWYMYASAPPYNPRRFAPEQVGDVLRQFLLTFWNTYSFFVTYANLDGWTPEVSGVGYQVSGNGNLTPIDRWALARLNALVRDVTRMLNEYDIHGPAKEIDRFVEELSNWYVRRNRRRFWKAEDDADKRMAYTTLYTCLTTLARLMAPFMPFVSEAVYRNLVAEQDPAAPTSVHLAGWPVANEALIDEQLLTDTALLLDTVTLCRAARQTSGLRVRQPLTELLVRTPGDASGLRRFEDELRDELNVKSVRLLEVDEPLVEYRFTPNLPVVGRKYRQLVPALKAALAELRGPAAQAAARAVEAGQPFELMVNGQAMLLTPDEVLMEASSPEGYAVAVRNRLMVALNTTVTPELRLEGQARDLVRFIQDARKSAGFDIADRITVTLEPTGDVDLEALLATYGDYVKAETLANSVELGSPRDGAFTAEAELEGGNVLVGVKKA